ncbi:hypothetical protein J3F83DRAFT_714872 [Trichoderma novae-zelandiae]
MTSSQGSPVARDDIEMDSLPKPQPAPPQYPSFREILSQENRTQSSSSIFVVVDGKERPKPAKVPNDAIIEVVREVADKDSINGIRNRDAVVIRDTKTRRGRGVFATRDLLPNHLIISEQPAVSF